MAQIKTTFAVSVLAHMFALASIAVIMPDATKLIEKELTPVELIDIQQAPQKTKTVAAVPVRKIERIEKKPLETSPVPMPVREKVEEVRQEVKPEPIIPIPGPAPVQRAETVESLPVHRHIEAPAPVAAMALKKENEHSPVEASLDTESAFNSYVIHKIDRAKLYPNWAKQRGYEGNVRVSFRLNQDGTVSDIKVVGPCECDILNKAACEAIKRAVPFNGGPIVASRARDLKVIIDFKLQK